MYICLCVSYRPTNLLHNLFAAQIFHSNYSPIWRFPNVLFCYTLNTGTVNYIILCIYIDIVRWYNCKPFSLKSLFPVIHFKTDHSLIFSTPQFHSKISCPLTTITRSQFHVTSKLTRDTRSNQPNTDLVLQETRYKKEDSNPHVHLFIPSTYHERERKVYEKRSTVLETPENLSLVPCRQVVFRPRPSRTTTDTIESLLSSPPFHLTGWQRDVCHNLPQQRDISQGLGRKVHGRRRKRYTLKGDGDV